MPQVQLPVFPHGTSPITPELAVQRKDNQVVYLNGHLRVFTHGADDLASFRLFSTQLIVNGTVTQGQVSRVFGVPLRTVKRCVKRYRQRGAQAFFQPPPKRQGHRLTAERLAQAQGLLDEGHAVPQISAQLEVLATTLHKAIDDGRLKQIKKSVKPEARAVASTTQSQRSAQDIQAPLGVGTTRAPERVLAAFGLLSEAPIQFELAQDVPQGGVLCALPALLELGLLRHSRKDFTLPAGFYPLESIFLVMAFLALARVRSLEALRYEAPGEWGKVLGLDRAPEVKTLRDKLTHLCADEPAVRRWSSTLAQEWMSAQPQSAGTLYIDGHVRVYHGGLTPLPRRYVARQRLCLRGTTDYWVNAMDGQPFFVVTQAADPGIIKVLEDEIVPRLLKEVPGQPTDQKLSQERWLARFTLIFDRAGYSPEFFRRLWEQRIAIITYHKFPQGSWDPEEFTQRTVRLVHGEEVTLLLAERGVRLSNGMWVREIRHLDETGHQTAILSTDYVRELDRVAVALFARWCQENFFQYMAAHYGLDKLIEYGTEPLPDTTVVVNPAWRQLDNVVRRERAKLVRQQAQFGAMRLVADADEPTTRRFEQEKGEQLQRIEQHEQTLAELKHSRKATPKHCPIKDLPEEQRFAQLRTTRKHFVDTIKLIAYRAETALVQVAREKLAREDDARALVRQILSNTVDLRPNLQDQTLTVRLHRLTTDAHDTVMAHLCEELTATETVYPGTDLRLIFEPIGATLLP